MCLDCGNFIRQLEEEDIPNIKNIQHLSPDQCTHPQDFNHYRPDISRICLVCGKNTNN